MVRLAFIIGLAQALEPSESGVPECASCCEQIQCIEDKLLTLAVGGPILFIIALMYLSIFILYKCQGRA